MMHADRPVERGKQSGVALVALLVIIVSAVSYVLLKDINAAATHSYRDEQTQSALAEAKAALIAYAASVRNLTPDRPGDLPCPDRNDDGSADLTPCNTSARRLGRLPWKTLGIPDLRDGSGERLWYAVSNSFKNNPRTICPLDGNPTNSTGSIIRCLNSDSRGTITIRHAGGGIVNDGNNPDVYAPDGAVAVIIAPGTALRREDGVNQTRVCTVGSNCNINKVCTTNPPINTPKCHPRNYLDRGNGEDNRDVDDVIENVSDARNGFIQGDIYDANGVIVNDRILAITHQDIMRRLEQRVAGEVLHCLAIYKADANNGARYPWAADVTASAASPANFADTSNTLFGRLPTTLTNTASVGTMQSSWPVGCKIPTDTSTSWWRNWRHLVFYAVAAAFQPASATPSPACGSTGTCLTLDPPSPGGVNRQVVIIVSGTRLKDIDAAGTDQQHATQAEKGNPINFLEGGDDGDENANLDDDDTYVSRPSSLPFNDAVCISGICP